MNKAHLPPAPGGIARALAVVAMLAVMGAASAKDGKAASAPATAASAPPERQLRDPSWNSSACKVFADRKGVYGRVVSAEVTRDGANFIVSCAIQPNKPMSEIYRFQLLDGPHKAPVEL